MFKAYPVWVTKLRLLEGMARFSGQLLAPVEGFGRGFFAFRAKKGLVMLFLPIVGHIWCSVVSFVTFCSNPYIFEEKQFNKGQAMDQEQKSFCLILECSVHCPILNGQSRR